MSKTTIDWDHEDANSGSFITYPAGLYSVVIKSWEKVKASTGTEQIRWKAEITEGEFAGKPVTDHTPLTEKSFWRIAILLKGCGLSLKGLGKMDIGSSAFTKVLNLAKGRRSLWNIVIEPNNKGKDRNVVQEYITPNDVEIQLASELIGSGADLPDFLK